MIGERLKKLRHDKNLLQKDVANYLNISTSAYGYYEQGKRNPDSDTLKNLADFFNVSTDYLLGRIDDQNYSIKHKTNLDSNNTQPSELESKIKQILLNEKVIKEDESISQDILDRIFKYGIEATIEILKLEKKLEE